MNQDMINQFEERIKACYGQEGKVWLSNLYDTVDRLAEKWDLTIIEVAPHLSYHYVLFAQQKSNAVVLKIGVDELVLLQEAHALQALEKHGVVKLLEQEKGALLLERVTPGKSLVSYFPEQDPVAVAICADIIKRLHSAPFSYIGLPRLEDWLLTLDKDLTIPKYHLRNARNTRDKLLCSVTEKVVLHGDLHHENILSSGNHWLAIDPKGIIGDPTYEPGAFIRNPLSQLITDENEIEIVQERIKLFSEELKMDPQRITDWAFVQAVLAWAWALEDRQDAEPFERIAILLGELTLF